MPTVVRLPHALKHDASIELPPIGVGTWSWGAPKWGWGTWDERLNKKAAMAAWDAFVAMGGGLVDTADDYGGGLSEDLIRAGMRRGAENVHIATKGSAQPSQLVAAAQASCRRLGVESVTLYQLHSVIEPIDAAADALAQIAKEGLAQCVGACNHNVVQLERLRKRLATKGVRLGSCQAHASLLAQQPFLRSHAQAQSQQPSLHEWCQTHGVLLIAYAPLASGRLARRLVEQPPRPHHKAEETPVSSGSGRAVPPALTPALIAPHKRGFGAGADTASLVPLLRMLASGPEGGGAVPADTALRWLTAHANVLAIPGCKTAAQVRENLGSRRDAAGEGKAMSPEVMELLGAAGRAAVGGRKS